MKFYIQTFGCQMNFADSREMAGELFLRGHSETKELKDADIVIVNTCAVRYHAEHRAFSYIGRLKIWKQQKPEGIIIVAGCVAEVMRKTLKNKFPHIDLIVGAKEIDLFPLKIDGLIERKKNKTAPGVKNEICAFASITRGCSHNCAYCIVPSARGKTKFIEPKTILQNVREKVSAGAKEITLLGQTVNCYRHKEIGDFSDLLAETAKIEGLERIRFMSPHPVYINDKFIQTMRDNPKIARHIHLPIQSGSDRMLKLMQRNYARKDIIDTISRLKTAVPDIAISTDFIVCFPTESEKDIKDTLSLFDECGFSFAYCFKFSPRQGTLAEKMDGHISEETAQKRLDILLKKAKETAGSALAAQDGKTAEVIMETENTGRTSNNFWVKTAEKQKPGGIIKGKLKFHNGGLAI